MAGLWKVAGRSAERAILGSLAVGLLTVVCFRFHVNFATTSLLYLLVLVMHSLTADFRSTATSAFVAFLCLDYFFVPPLFSFNVTDPFNLLAIFSFLITALVITHFASRARQEARASDLQRRSLDSLYRLAQQLLAMEPEVSMGRKSLELFRAASNSRAMCLFDAGTGELHAVGESHSGLPDRTRDTYIMGHDTEDAASAVYVRCLYATGRATGAIGFEGLASPESQVGPLAALAASLLERARAFRRASQSAAAAQAEVYRSAVLDALAHEFKNPLATIVTAAGGLREAGCLRPEQQELADMVETEAVQLGTLTSRLLRVARLDREEVKPRMELVDLMALLDRTIKQYSRRMSERRLFLQNACGSAQVIADPELIHLALNQLVDNACKYSAPGSPVTFGIEKRPDSVAIRVSNSGSSIPRHEETQIFERFRRGDEVRHRVPGSGLGLYVARKIAVAHGGSLDLERSSAAGDGATFRLTIPTTKGELEHVVTTS